MMVEKNSGVPSTVAVPLQQPERGESAPDVEVAPQAKRSRKAKTKQDTETCPVPNQDPVNADQSALVADVAGTGTPIAPLAVDEPKEPTAPPTENPVAIPDQKRKPKRPRPPPAIEHKRVVHYYRESRPNKGHGRRGDDKDRRNGGSSRGRHNRDEKKTRSDDDDDDDDELLSDSDWNVDSGDETDPSDDDSKSDDETDDGKRDTGSIKRTVKKHESEKEARRDDGGRFAPVHAVMQYKIV